METVQPTKIDFVRDMVRKNPGTTHKDIIQAWVKSGRSKLEAPHATTIYKARSEMKIKKNKMKVVPAADAVATSASVASPTEPRPEPPAIVVEKEAAVDWNSQPAIPVKLKVAEVDQKVKAYEEIEQQLDDLLSHAKQVRDGALSEAIRKARRLASKQLV